MIAAACGVSGTAHANLIISEVVDGTLSGGLPKYVELTNTGSTSIDLSLYSIGNYNNGGTTLGGPSTVLSGTLAAGDSYVISYENSDSAGDGTFFDVYGFDPDNIDLGAFINGDDVVALFLGPATGDGSDATLVDIVGVIGTDGTGEPWEYDDSYAFRNFNVTSPNSTFTASEWTFAGANALIGEDAAGHVAVTDPGTHSFVPEPGSLALLGLGGLLLARRRRG
ncbi:MAG: lamin tail domain-containing protein [Planctomycetota bacterium]